MRLLGSPLRLAEYPCESIVNRQFADLPIAQLDRIYLPIPLTSLLDKPPLGSREFLEDDNRGAVSPDPVATLDGRPYYLSVKGVGSTVDPYSAKPLDVHSAADLAEDPDVRRRLQSYSGPEPERVITGELWLRGSPYGGQGLEHAMTALRVSERADLTSLGGFQIAPVVKVCRFPDHLVERLRHIYWYRKFPGEFVQEIRLVPSNIRIYFHARNTVGSSVRHIFDLFGIDSNGKALAFETNFLRTTIAMLTLFARTLSADPSGERYRGLDFHDVWLDKDAVLAPDGSVHFVDLEGIEDVEVERSKVRERIEDQIYRTLYELSFAYEQIEEERARRFGEGGTRKRHFEGILREAVRGDPFVRLESTPGRLEIVFLNKLQEPSFDVRFPAVDWTP